MEHEMKIYASYYYQPEDQTMSMAELSGINIKSILIIAPKLKYRFTQKESGGIIVERWQPKDGHLDTSQLGDWQRVEVLR